MNKNESSFIAETRLGIREAFDRIIHCLNQLSDDQVWWRPNDQMNSIGNLVLHVCGNLRQWVVAHVGGNKDVRNRPEEFSERGPIPVEELRQKISLVKEDINQVLDSISGDDLSQYITIQGFELTKLTALYRTTVHLEGHAGQVLYITRIQKGDDYNMFWKPKTTEEIAAKYMDPEL